MGHVAAVRCVQYDGKRVVSGAYDYMVKVWDPDTETCLHTLQGHTNRVYSLQVCTQKEIEKWDMGQWPKGPSIFFSIITSVQRVLFFTTPLSPLKVNKSSEKNDDGGRFHEIKHADPDS
jgi:WD40 repeat protein